MKIVAVKKFRDKETQALYSPGDVISTFPESRAVEAVNRDLAVILNENFLKEEAPKKTVPAEADVSIAHTKELDDAVSSGSPNSADLGQPQSDIDMTQQWQKIVAAVKTFEDVEKLKGYLEAENASGKPRVSVVLALDNRIKELSDK